MSFDSKSCVKCERADLLSYSACLLQGHRLTGHKINGGQCVYRGACYTDRFGDEWAIWMPSRFSFLLPHKPLFAFPLLSFELKTIQDLQDVYCYLMQFDYNTVGMGSRCVTVC